MCSDKSPRVAFRFIAHPALTRSRRQHRGTTLFLLLPNAHHVRGACHRRSVSKTNPVDWRYPPAAQSPPFNVTSSLRTGREKFQRCFVTNSGRYRRRVSSLLFSSKVPLIDVHLCCSAAPRNPWFTPNTTTPTEQQQSRRSSSASQVRLSLIQRVKAFFGIGPDASRTRKALVSVVWSLAYGFFQVCRLSPTQVLH